MKKLINVENVEARLEAQFSRLVPVLGQGAADILLDQSMTIIRDEAELVEEPVWVEDTLIDADAIENPIREKLLMTL